MYTKLFLLTHPSRDVTRLKLKNTYQVCISTHTSLAGCDTDESYTAAVDSGFLLTHPSRDVTRDRHDARAANRFLLTHPSRDVTCKAERVLSYSSISTHTSLAGCDYPQTRLDEVYNISTHTSLAGCDCPDWKDLIQQLIISTHTSLAGCDAVPCLCCNIHNNFYSHIPRGM